MWRYNTRGYQPKPRPFSTFVIDSMESASSASSGQPTKLGDVPVAGSPGVSLADRITMTSSPSSRGSQRVTRASRAAPKPLPPGVDLSRLAIIMPPKKTTPVASAPTPASLPPPHPSVAAIMSVVTGTSVPVTTSAPVAAQSRKRLSRIVDDSEEEEHDHDAKFARLECDVMSQIAGILERLEAMRPPAPPTFDFTCFVKTDSISDTLDDGDGPATVFKVGVVNAMGLGFPPTTAQLPRNLVSMMIRSLGIKYGGRSDATDVHVFVQTALFQALMDIRALTCLMLTKAIPRTFAYASIKAKLGTIFDICYRTARFEGGFPVANDKDRKLFESHVVDLTNFWVNYADALIAVDADLSRKRYFRLDLALDHFIPEFVDEYSSVGCLAKDSRRQLYLVIN